MKLFEAEVGLIDMAQADENTRPTSTTGRGLASTGEYFHQTYGSKPTAEQEALIEQYENFDMILYKKAVEIFEARLRKYNHAKDTRSVGMDNTSS